MPETDLPFIPIEEQFKIMADTAPVLIWISNTEKLCYFFNKGWLDFTGRTMEEEYGNGWADGVHPDDLNRCLDIYISSFDQRIPFKMEYRLRRHDGEYRWLLDNGVPRYTATGEFAGYIGSCIDINEMKEADLMKENFISIASHELRTPLTSLSASLQMVERVYHNNPLNIKLPGLLKSATSSLRKLSMLVHDLLNVSIIKEGKLLLERSSVSLTVLIQESAEQFSMAGKHELVIEGDTGLNVFADARKVEQVLINLLNNAVKYAPNSSKIIIGVKKENSFARVYVTDFGPGIPAESIKNLFERYYQASSDSESNSGLGLGLYIAHEIIRQHEGNIGVDSEVNKGSTFWFTLPLIK